MATLCARTPKITVRDNRGLDVRTLRYNRSVDGVVPTQYVDATIYNTLSQAVSSQDPRFFGGMTLNFRYTPALSGQVLQTAGVDAGTSNACADIAGQPVQQFSHGRDSGQKSDNDITIRTYYDALGRPVQRDRVTSDADTGVPVGGTSDLWIYGDTGGPPNAAYDPLDTSDPCNANLRGQLLRHFDTAGLLDMGMLGYGVVGSALRQDRSFLAVTCDAANNWDATDTRADGTNKQKLEAGAPYSTRWTYNALAQALTQTDAKGHQQHTAYDCAARKSSAAVTPKGGNLSPVTTAITYTAAGEVDTRSDANGIQVVHTYEPQRTQRLVSMTALRATTRLQALAYTYDGVGNVIALADAGASAQVSFFRNRAATPDRGYGYDALYQLTSATGRESYTDSTPSGTDWPANVVNPSATSNLTQYQRSYTYDLGGNLTTIGSSDWSGASSPTRNMVVGRASNRAVSTARPSGSTPTPDNVDVYFDRAGQSICIDGNAQQPLYWTAFHQLYCAVTLYRAPSGAGNVGGAPVSDWSDSDYERYAYDGDGRRVRKYSRSQAGNSANTTDTRYLPGLELRNDSGTGENLEVIVLDDGARILNWASGKPADIPNLQLRYQYSDRQNSCLIETDAGGSIITQEEYYPYGGTAVLASRSGSEVKYKYIRYSGKERDATGLYYYGLRYYQPWTGRWLNPDPAGTVDGQNVYCMVGNNPATFIDQHGAARDTPQPDDVQLRPLDDASSSTAGRQPPVDSTPSLPALQHLNLDGQASAGYPRDEDVEERLEADLVTVGFDWVTLTAHWPEDSARAFAAAGSTEFLQDLERKYGVAARKSWQDAVGYLTGREDPASLTSDSQRFALLSELAGIKTGEWDQDIAEFRAQKAERGAIVVNPTDHLNASRQQLAFQNWIISEEAAMGSTGHQLASEQPPVESPPSSSQRSADSAAWRRIRYVRNQLLTRTIKVNDKYDKTIGYRLITKDPFRPGHQFQLEISKKKIRTLRSFRAQKTPEYFASDVTAYQILRYTQTVKIDPRNINILEINTVANADTLLLLNKYAGTRRKAPEIGADVEYARWGAGDARLDEFMSTTPHGKRVANLMADMGKSVTAMWEYTYKTCGGNQLTDLFFFTTKSGQPRHPAMRNA